ncbi:MAG TPA: hypothetical protein VK163_00575 [Opitutaceae bacterium]|nr:hypothetical protein [Opitutaceae bacterium]
MRASTTAIILLASGLLAVAGCAHRLHPSAIPVAPITASDQLLLDHAARLRLVHIYIDADTMAPVTLPAAEFGPANTVAASLRELLRERGFDVRATELVLPRGDTGIASGALARAIAAGDRPPEVSRAVTYLHPNAPRLVLFVRLDGNVSPANLAAPSLVLGAFIADSADGAILWSNRVASTEPATDAELRLLATQLLKNLPNLPPV